MNDIITFHRNTIRAIIDEYDELWFFAKDVCDALGITDIEGVINGVEAGFADTIEVLDDQGVPQKVDIVGDFVLDEIIYMAHNPEGKFFKRWIEDEVLPTVYGH